MSGHDRALRTVAARACALGIAVGIALPASTATAHAQKAVGRPDGVYSFQVRKHVGELALKSIKGGVLFQLATTAPNGATCEARGKALGGTVLTYRDEQGTAAKPAGFRLTIDRDRVTATGLLNQVSDSVFCGHGGLLTGPYKRTAPLDAKTAAELDLIGKAPAVAAPAVRARAGGAAGTAPVVVRPQVPQQPQPAR